MFQKRRVLYLYHQIQFCCNLETENWISFCKVFVCLFTLKCVNKCTEKELQVYRYFALMLFCAFHLCTSHFKITFIKYKMEYLLGDVLFPIPQFMNINPAVVPWGLCDPSPLWLTFFFKLSQIVTSPFTYFFVRPS